MVSPRARRRFAWIAVFAVLLNVLVPAMSQAVAAQLGFTWLEICTKDGLKRIAVRYEGARPDLPPGAHVATLEHCSHCVPQGAPDLHGPAPGLRVAVLACPQHLVAAPVVASPILAPLARVHARAPPSLA